MTQAEIQAIIRGFVLAELITGDAGKTLTDHESLFQYEVIDSVSILQLLVFVDNQFDVRIESEDVSRENFDSITRLAAYVRQRMSSAREQGEKIAA